MNLNCLEPEGVTSPIGKRGRAHWHGVSSGNRLIHMVITHYKGDNNVTWFQPVSEEQYNYLIK